MKVLFRFLFYGLFGAALLIQVYVINFYIWDVYPSGHASIGSGILYGGLLPFSLGLFLLGAVLSYRKKTMSGLKWLHIFYWGSHILLIGLMWAFPVQFAP